MDTSPRPVACTVAGSDSGGGAGIQADLLSFAACGVHGATVVTAITAQDTRAVHAVEPVSLEMVARQIDAVALDLQPAAWKTGMLPTPQIAAVVAQRLAMHGAERLVVDPVLRSTSGAALSSDPALVTLREALLPEALVVTPNWPEAEALTGLRISSLDDARAAARAVAARGPRWVVITGGHDPSGSDEVTDLVFDAGADSFTTLAHPRIPGGADRHGTGCSFSAALTAHLARGLEVLDAAREASSFVAALLARGPSGVGAGHAPLVHLG
ncbi:MAG TPA: bifunctional hydroxymethylpyrimidine kinase/phosphomethylpyrimidine kinase [Candidatus Dormibacteraeota bacterium]|nr:bifunctional hydroxymethylpyrimidine kinase/phosphomethylpyrimidine kinase [Candidatus Dormibacteraeota bacterium]